MIILAKEIDNRLESDSFALKSCERENIFSRVRSRILTGGFLGKEDFTISFSQEDNWTSATPCHLIILPSKPF